jgi:hypothetical protein
VQGNICARNARLGVCVNAFQTGIILSGNICHDNPANLSLRGDYCSSSGDFCSGKGGVIIEGRGNQVNGLVALCPLNISATDLTYTGGIISGTEDEPLMVAMEIARKTADRRTALVDGVRIRQVTMKHCRTAVTISGVVKDVRFSDNRIQARGEAFRVAEECRSEVNVEANEISKGPASHHE